MTARIVAVFKGSDAARAVADADPDEKIDLAGGDTYGCGRRKFYNSNMAKGKSPQPTGHVNLRMLAEHLTSPRRQSPSFEQFAVSKVHPARDARPGD